MLSFNDPTDKLQIQIQYPTSQYHWVPTHEEFIAHIHGLEGKLFSLERMVTSGSASNRSRNAGEESEEKIGEKESGEEESEETESESEDWSCDTPKLYVTFIYLFIFSWFIFYYALWPI